VRGRFIARFRFLVVLACLLTIAVVLPAGPALADTQASPSPREGVAMAFDAAHGQTVLFGGSSLVDRAAGTWTWNGSVWTKHTPAHTPKLRWISGMTYDAATGLVVLFGGGPKPFGDTWTWDGVDWTKQRPLHSPPARQALGMAYDAATEQVVVFGGNDGHELLGDTWTWDGTDWTQQTSAHSPPPREGMGMAYDPVGQQILLFGGLGAQSRIMRDTWTWDGTDWTRLSPADRPPARWRPAMASWSDVLLFGGLGRGGIAYADTWVWNGDDWRNRTSVHAPLPRYLSAGAFDEVRGNVALFGGAGTQSDLGDTWTWGDGDWTRRLAGSISEKPRSGDPGTSVHIDGWGFARNEPVDLSFVDSAQGLTSLGSVTASGSGGFALDVTIPASATQGTQEIQAVGRNSGQTAVQEFRVR
jgi:hypothetical protein